MDETTQALCEVGRLLGADEIVVCPARTSAPTCERLVDRNGNVLLPADERAKVCADCARGEEVLLLDDRGVMVGLYEAGPGVWSHGYDSSWWPCPGVRKLEAARY